MKTLATDTNPYQAYTDGSVFSDNPLHLVIALYEGALDATRQAERALEAHDILGRGKAINKANAILAELLMALDHERGGEISQNLKRLYCYMHMQLSTAHARQSAEPIVEVASLLTTLLEGWRSAAETPMEGAVPARSPSADEPASKQQSAPPAAPDNGPFYGGYLDESAAGTSSAYSFLRM